MTIEEDVAAKGLVPFVIDTQPDRKDVEHIDALARVVSTGDPVILNHGAESALAAIEGFRFFQAMNFLAVLIPKLDVEGAALMRLVAAFVRKGGEDLAANEPNRALRDWCAQDRARSDRIVADAREGDALAISHLTFALEAAEDVPLALSLLDAGDTDVRRGAVVALGRLQASGQIALDEAARVAWVEEDELTAHNALYAAVAIAARQKGLARAPLHKAMVHLLAERSDNAIHLAADLMWRHGKTLPEDEFALCIDTVRHVPAKNKGTLKAIDMALSSLRETPRFLALCALVRDIVDRTDGEAGLDDFDGFAHLLREDRTAEMVGIVIDWLLHGTACSRKALASYFVDVGERNAPLIVSASDLPDGAAMQGFLCRKAVGFLFLDPRSAAAFPLAVLRCGDTAAHEAALDVLCDPLLRSYGGMVELLKAEIEAGHPASDALRTAIDRKKAIHDGAAEARTLTELRPSEGQREIERVRHEDAMRQAAKAGHEHSILRDLVTTQYLLYGRSSASYVDEGDGKLRKVEMAMHEHSFSSEFPMINILDPVGLDILLLHLRAEPRPEDAT